MPETRGRYRQEKPNLFSFSQKGKNYLFVVGVNKYVHFRQLTNAVKDARDLIDVLTANYHFEPENIVTLFDEAATRKNIFDKFEYFANKLEKGDNLVIYFSGHGYLNTRTNIGYWIPLTL
ncbi:caspase family protein [Rhodoflexus caldus]|uniref:caspase family protein n=1 Tax=Rhodoflexus caldus TaxID=2891236 RepID=UPI00202A6A35|nr:caspase family protein [Rhodoflexus caldus]